MPEKSANVAVLLLCFFLCIFSLGEASGEEKEPEYWSSTFYGLSWELSGSFGGRPAVLESAQIDALSLAATYGSADLFRPVPLRLRAGLGWWKARPFMVSAGMEIALLELLSPAHTRMTGLYAFADVHMRISTTGIRFSFEPSARILIPLHGMGGIALGVGYDTDIGLTWHIENMNGVYPLK